MLVIFEHRRALCKFRISNHRLMIELGRHQGLAVENRICKVCKVVEDEEHFFTACRRNEKLRESMYSHIMDTCVHFEDLSGRNKLIFTMSTTDENSLKVISKFIHASFLELEKKETSGSQ